MGLPLWVKIGAGIIFFAGLSGMLLMPANVVAGLIVGDEWWGEQSRLIWLWLAISPIAAYISWQVVKDEPF